MDLDESDMYLEALKQLGLLDQLSGISDETKTTKTVVKTSGKSKNKIEVSDSEDVVEELMKMAEEYEVMQNPAIYLS